MTVEPDTPDAGAGRGLGHGHGRGVPDVAAEMDVRVNLLVSRTTE